MFFHNRHALRNRLEEAQAAEPLNEALIADLQVVIDFIQEEHGAVLADIGSLQSAGEITWPLLWALFSPNELVYHYHELTEQDQVLKFCSITWRSRPSTNIPYWDIRCDILADDGTGFGFAKEPMPLEIDEFDGTRKIQDLLLYPLRYHRDESRIREESLARGRVFSTLDKPSLLRTSGQAMWEKRDANYRPRWFKFASQGRAIADAAAVRLAHPNTQFIPNVYRRLSRDKLTEEQLIICTPVVLGFNFGTKQWGMFTL